MQLGPNPASFEMVYFPFAHCAEKEDRNRKKMISDKEGDENIVSIIIRRGSLTVNLCSDYNIGWHCFPFLQNPQQSQDEVSSSSSSYYSLLPLPLLLLFFLFSFSFPPPPPLLILFLFLFFLLLFFLTLPPSPSLLLFLFSSSFFPPPPPLYGTACHFDGGREKK